MSRLPSRSNYTLEMSPFKYIRHALLQIKARILSDLSRANNFCNKAFNINYGRYRQMFKEVNSLDMEINAEIECYISTIKEP